MITSTCGPYYLGGSATAGIGAIIVRAIIVCLTKLQTDLGQMNLTCYFGPNCLLPISIHFIVL
jgi:hypothetical protein